MRTERFEEALQAYSAARAARETLAVLRKLGSAALRCGERTGDMRLIRNACGYYDIIAERYAANADDAINYTQICLTLNERNKYELCARLLRESPNAENDCRVCFMQAQLSDEIQDNQTEMYCRRAKQLYEALSEDEKLLISSESLKEMQALYRRCCGTDW